MTRAIVNSILLTVLSLPVSAQEVRFVNAAAPPGGDGLTWATAYNKLFLALDEAAISTLIDQVWVASGVYTPNRGTGARTDSFVLVGGLAIYGGFDGTETSLEQRDPAAHVTTLSGDFNGNDGANFTGMNDNARHVVTGTDLTETVTLDGLTIRSGNYDLAGSTLLGGGGVYLTRSSVVIENCIFTNNVAGKTAPDLGGFGGAVLLRGGTGTVNNCTFERNRGMNGGALNIDDGAATLVGHYNFTVSNCRFLDNFSPSQTAGGMRSAQDPFNGNSTLTVTGCLFDSNVAEYFGAQYAINTTHITIRDCTYIGNSSRVLGGALNHTVTAGVDSEPILVQGCTFIGNSTTGAGGGLIIQAADAIVRDCAFFGNNADTFGSAITSTTYFTDFGGQDLDVANCVFAGNTGGVGTIDAETSPILRVANCTLVGNSGSAITGGIFSFTFATEIANTILWNNDVNGVIDQDAQVFRDTTLGGQFSIDFSIIQGLDGSLGGSGNIDADPLVVDALGPDAMPGSGDEDLALLAGSPAIDAGENALIPSDVSTDFFGGPRRVDDPATVDTGGGAAPIVDIGAIEFQPIAACPADFNHDGLRDLSDLGILLANFGVGAGADPDDGDTDGDGDIDLSDLGVMLSVFGIDCP